MPAAACKTRWARWLRMIDSASTKRNRVQRGPSAWRGWVITAMLGVSLGALSGWLLVAQPGTAAIDNAPTTAATYPLTAVEYDDGRNVPLTVTRGDDRDLTVAATGTVTAVACTPGDAWVSGDTPLSIDGSPLVTLALSTPLFRDLVGGERGPDVEGVQAALARLSYEPGDSGRFDWQTRVAVAKFLKDRGVAASDSVHGALRLSDIIWLPTSETPIATCAVQVGDRVDAFAPIATMSHTATAISATLPADLMPGERTLTVGGITHGLDDEGRLTDSAAVTEMLATPVLRSYTDALRDDPDTSAPTGTIALASPLTAFAVPPSALSDVSTGSACVHSDDQSYRVKIISSSLGLTYIAFGEDNAAPQSVTVIAAKDATCG